jgi:hypothetical protein
MGEDALEDFDVSSGMPCLTSPKHPPNLFIEEVVVED